MDKEKKRRLAYEIMIVFGVLILLAFITRIWPLVLLLFLAIIICALRMLFLSFSKVEPIISAEAPTPPPSPETEQTLYTKAFALLQTRITEKLMERFPTARWIWLAPNPFERFTHGETLIISLNGAGGYMKATIKYHNLMLCSLEFEGVEAEDGTPPEAPANDPDYDPDYADEVSAGDEHVEAEPGDAEEMDCSETPVNYERLAFDWVESHMFVINEKANEALANSEKEVLFSEETLPSSDSWVDICTELTRNGFVSAERTENGICALLP